MKRKGSSAYFGRFICVSAPPFNGCETDPRELLRDREERAREAGLHALRGFSGSDLGQDAQFRRRLHRI